MPTTGRPPCDGLPRLERRQGALDPDHPQPRLSGPVPRARCVGSAHRSSFHIDGLEFYDQLSFLKGGIVYASHLTTVSATYATRDHYGRSVAVGRPVSDPANANQLTGILNDRQELGPANRRATGAAVRRRRLGGQAGQCRLCLSASSGLRYRAVRSSAWSPGSCIRRGLIRAVRRRRDHRGRRTDRVTAPASRIEQALVDAHRRRPDASGSHRLQRRARRGESSLAAISP